MEEEMHNETWAWMEDDFRLDTDSALVSRSLWDDFTSSEAVVRSLFPSTPGPQRKDLAPSAFCFGRPDSFERSESWEVIPECNLSPLKRRCTLRIWDEDMINSTLPESGPIKCDDELDVGFVGENSQVTCPSSSNSPWYITNEESHSSVNGAVEQSSGSWMVECFSDSDTSDVQEIPPPLAIDFQFNAVASKASLARTAGDAAPKRTPRNAPSKYAPMSNSKQSKGQAQLKSRAHVTTNHGGNAKDSPKPVLAYPFALVKPSGIQGDVTLQDINQRIKMAPSKPRPGLKDSFCVSSTSPLSGKAVVGLTKIQTEGKGTITILRTRS